MSTPRSASKSVSAVMVLAPGVGLLLHELRTCARRPHFAFLTPQSNAWSTWHRIASSIWLPVIFGFGCESTEISAISMLTATHACVTKFVCCIASKTLTPSYFQCENICVAISIEIALNISSAFIFTSPCNASPVTSPCLWLMKAASFCSSRCIPKAYRSGDDVSWSRLLMVLSSAACASIIVERSWCLSSHRSANSRHSLPFTHSSALLSVYLPEDFARFNQH